MVTAPFAGAWSSLSSYYRYPWEKAVYRSHYVDQHTYIQCDAVDESGVLTCEIFFTKAATNYIYGQPDACLAHLRDSERGRHRLWSTQGIEVAKFCGRKGLDRSLFSFWLLLLCLSRLVVPLWRQLTLCISCSSTLSSSLVARHTLRACRPKCQQTYQYEIEFRISAGFWWYFSY